MYLVYRTVNQFTQEFYIGVHKAEKPDGYLGSGRQLKQAIAKYGASHFIRETLFTFATRVEAYEKERELVEPLLDDPMCLNLHVGGRGGFQFINRSGLHETATARAVLAEKRKDPEVRERYRINALNARLASPACRASTQRLIGLPNAWIGKQHTEETRQKMSSSHTGKHTGEQNVCFGTCWVTLDGKSQRVKKDEAALWESQGWVRGRKMKKRDVG